MVFVRTLQVTEAGAERQLWHSARQLQLQLSAISYQQNSKPQRLKPNRVFGDSVVRLEIVQLPKPSERPSKLLTEGSY